MDLQYNPYSPVVCTDPWPLYKRMRDEAPVYYIEEFDAWALSRFEDVWQASLDTKSYTAKLGTSLDALLLAKAPQPSIFLFKDPPEHAAYRNIISVPYLKPNIAALTDTIRKTTSTLLAADLASGRLDVHSLASKVALLTIADMLGLNETAIFRIRALIDDFYRREPGINGTTPSGVRAFHELCGFLGGLIGDLRRDPPAPSSHIGAWLNSASQGKPLSDDELIFSIFAMTVTGSDTVPLAIAATIHYLTETPDALTAVRADPNLLAAAFEESVRFDQPTNVLGRVLTRDIELHGKQLKQGQVVLFLYASACRDEREFDQADRYLIERKQTRSISFGTGPHFCLGQHLARLEGKIILEELFKAIPEFAVDKSGRKRIFGEFLQGFNSMPIEFDPRGARVH